MELDQEELEEMEMEIDQEEPEEMGIEETIGDTVEAATQEPSSPEEPTDEGIMDIVHEVETVLQSSTFINEEQERGTPARGLESDVVMQEIASPAQENMNIETSGGVKQKKPLNLSEQGEKKEITREVDIIP